MQLTACFVGERISIAINTSDWWFFPRRHSFPSLRICIAKLPQALFDWQLLWLDQEQGEEKNFVG